MRPRLPAASDRLPPSFPHTWRPTRRQVGWGTIGTAVLGGAVLDARPPGFVANFHDEWRIFRERHVAEDGRVVDDGAGGVTHSEGTGYGLLLASAAEDLGSFERILAWSAHRLRRQDGLHAWRWLPGALDPTPDRNNATDGDLLIAWALQRAARLFGRADFLAGARRIAEQVLSQCAREVGGRLVLLPAAHGFERRDHTMVNPSYYVWPALRDLERLVPGRSWRRLSTDGLSLSDAARFGRWGLPADWIDLPHDPPDRRGPRRNGRPAFPGTPSGCRCTPPGPGTPTTPRCWRRLNSGPPPGGGRFRPGWISPPGRSRPIRGMGASRRWWLSPAPPCRGDGFSRSFPAWPARARITRPC